MRDGEKGNGPGGDEGGGGSARLLLSMREVAARCVLGQRTLWRLVGLGEFPAPIRLGRRRLWHAPTLERWLAERAAEAERKRA